MTARLDPRLRGFASTMRNEPTAPEAALWRRLRSSQLGGFKFRRQSVFGAYIADFFRPSIGLFIELDGNTHDTQRDARRDATLRQQGFEILRFTNHEIGTNLDGVLTTILTAAQARPRRSGGLPHPPTPSPEGEGEQ